MNNISASKVSSNSASARLLAAQLASLAVSRDGLESAELRNAQLLDPHVTTEDVAHVRDTIFRAQDRFFKDGHATLMSDTRVLFCPTAATVDIPINQAGWLAIVTRAVKESSVSEIQKMIEHGPAQNALVWSLCETPQQLVASVVRWAQAKGKEKTRLRTHQDVRSWVEETLHEGDIHPIPKLGGVAAVGGVLVHALGGQAAMFCAAPISKDVFPLLPSDMGLILPAGNEKKVLEHVPSISAAPNFAIEWNLSDKNLNAFANTAIPNTILTPSTEVDLILVSAEPRPAFQSFTDDELKLLGSKFDMAVVNGIQHLKNSDDVTHYINSLHALRAGGTALGLLFTEPDRRYETVRASLYTALLDNSTFDFIGMNANEVHALLSQLLSTARSGLLGKHSDDVIEKLGDFDNEPEMYESLWGSFKEAPVTVVQHALMLQSILKIPIVRIRSNCLDVVITSERPIDPSRVRDHLIVSRNLGTLKVAHSEGILNSPDDIQPLDNVPDGAHIAAVHFAASALRHLSAMSTKSTNKLEDTLPELPLEKSFWTSLPDGRTVFVVPTIPFYDVTGGKVSAGDTQDTSFLAAEAKGLLQEVRNQRH